MSNTALRVALLTILDECRPYLLPQPALLAQARLSLPGLIQSEFDRELRAMETRGWITSARDEITEEPKWRLTDLGRTYVP